MSWRELNFFKIYIYIYIYIYIKKKFFFISNNVLLKRGLNYVHNDEHNITKKIQLYAIMKRENKKVEKKKKKKK